MDVIIIGAGASGLMAAINVKEGNNVIVLERYGNSAKKILVTGNGRCNYWNENFSNKYFHSSNSSFIEQVNTETNRASVLDKFEQIGIVPTIKNGYYYPMSMQASTIRNALLDEANKRNIKIYNDINVIKVNKSNDRFEVITSDKVFSCDKLIIATGSNSYYKDETSGYDICKNLGHNIVTVLPSLVQLVGEDNYFKDWDGVRKDATISIFVDNNKLKEETGEVMLTNYGLSGICIFNLSGIATRALNNNLNVEIGINFLPFLNPSNVYDYFEERSKIFDANIDKFLESLMNYKLVYVILSKSNVDKNKKWSLLSEEEKKTLCNHIIDFRVKIISSKSFSDSQVSSGGVDTKEIDPLTMESKLIKGLYIVGELLDVDGDCGGYNLGFAWLSGMIAGRSVDND